MKFIRRSSLNSQLFAPKNKHNKHVILSEVKNLLLLPALIYVGR